MKPNCRMQYIEVILSSLVFVKNIIDVIILFIRFTTAKAENLR